MTNSIGTRGNSFLGNASTMLGSASTMLGSAKEAFKAMADAAVNNPAESPAAIAATAAKKGRRGTVLDRYA
ncbi:hypothetical protein [Actinoplanes subglobosus]|uniref:Uncharacterized protein n=1 Tax=Actinoplanes subglobosus TaxID=1547892 RepID=A0ABV8IR26_9ACTN